MAPSPLAMEQVTSSEVDASTSAPPPAVEMVEAVPPPPLVDEPIETPSERPPQGPATETPLAFAAKDSVPPEDSSFPPVDLDSHFFNPTPETDDTHERDPRMVLKLGPEAARRRAQFQKYVKIAVAAASVLCLAALVKGAVSRNHDEPTLHHTSAALVAPPPPQLVQTAAPAVQEVPAPPERPAAPAEPQGTAPVESAVAAPAPAPTEQAPAAPAASVAEEAAPTATDTAEAPAPDPKEAAKAKRASQTALERGKLAAAIEAGEQSVALDPTDAEAWLILGAAYQEKGDQKNARRSFKSCLEQGKRGPKWECAQMPH
ncbi:MAG TPA: tetratricopeptide repeat protein [Polyangiaceae bacterium]